MVRASNKKKIGKFSFNSTVKGEYKLGFSNLHSVYEKSVVLGIYNQEEAEQQEAVIEKEFESVQRWAHQQNEGISPGDKLTGNHIDIMDLKKLTL